MGRRLPGCYYIVYSDDQDCHCMGGRPSTLAGQAMAGRGVVVAGKIQIRGWAAPAAAAHLDRDR